MSYMGSGIKPKWKPKCAWNGCEEMALPGKGIHISGCKLYYCVVHWKSVKKMEELRK